MSQPPSLCLAQPHPHTWQVNSLDGIILITRDTVIEESPMSLSLDSHSVMRQEEGGGRGERLGESREEGKRKRPYLLFSKFVMERPHFQVNCNTALLSLFLKELP